MESGDAFRLLVAAEKKNPRVRSLTELAKSRGIPVVEISAAALSAKLQGAKHQGVAAESEAESPLEMRELPSENAKENSLILALDGVTDPRNLGACLRVAAAFNADFVIVPRRRAAGLTPVAQKAASGAAISLCRVVNFARALEELKQRGFFIVGAAADAKANLYDANLSGAVAWILGGESGGLRRLTREKCDMLARIPTAEKMESLNVAVACGICLSESRRRLREAR